MCASSTDESPLKVNEPTVSEDEATSRSTTRECRQVSNTPHLLTTTIRLFVFKGPKRSTPVCVKVGSKAVVRNVGKSAIICSVLVTKNLPFGAQTFSLR